MRCALLTAEAMPTGKLCCCCRKRSQLATRLTLSRTCARMFENNAMWLQKTSLLQASVAPEDLKETIESEDEDEGRTPQVEVKQHKEESAKESQESGEDKEAKES